MGFDPIINFVASAKLSHVWFIFLGVITIRTLYSWLYNSFFNPLRKFPGPKLAGASELYLLYYTFWGQKHLVIDRLHEKYGDVVRVAPDQLSFITETAWKDIYSYRGKDRSQMPKGDGRTPQTPPYSIINSPDDVHARQRKILSNSFSERALREQEPLLASHISLLVSKLHMHADQGKPIDLTKYFEFTTSDIIGDFCYAESFGQLKSGEQDPFLGDIHKLIPFTVRLRAITGVVKRGIISSARSLFLKFRNAIGISSGKMTISIEERVKRRIDMGTDQKDMMTHVIGHISETGDGISIAELASTSFILMLAGSETTATTLAGSMFYLLKNRDILDILAKEIRTTFSSDEDLTIIKVSQLAYLTAVIEESLRIYSPVPVALNRIVPSIGAPISGYWVPGNTVVGIPHRAAFRSARNFADPLSFKPERWLSQKDSKFNNDNDLVFQPFSVGPRNCLGKNLAYAEMRLILARLLLNFDFELVDKESQWDEQQAFILYQKPPLMVHVKSRV